MTVHRVGIMGGTFDPVHNGHLIAARLVAQARELEMVLLSPVARPWHKSADQLASAVDRIAMLELAVQDDPILRVTTVDIDRGGDTYTIDTLADLAAGCLHEFPGHEFEWFFIAGADAVAGLASWKSPEEILRRARIIAITRPGFEFVLPDVSGAEGIEILPIEAVDISSTLIREITARGESLEGLVPELVEEYIYERGLYSSQDS